MMQSIRSLVIGLVAAVPAMSCAADTVAAENVAVIGTGRMGTAIGGQLARLGYQVIYGSRDPASERVGALLAEIGRGASADTQAGAAAQADLVVLAVPWRPAEQIVRGMGDLSGKIIIDVTNALEARDGLMTMAVESSAGELIQSWAPQAKVVKAFNAVGFHIIADPSVAGGPVSIPIVGDDGAAKQRVADLVERMGFEAVDVGPMRHAHILEGLAVLYMVPYMSGRREDAFEYYLRRGTSPADSEGVRPAG